MMKVNKTTKKRREDVKTKNLKKFEAENQKRKRKAENELARRKKQKKTTNNSNSNHKVNNQLYRRKHLSEIFLTSKETNFGDYFMIDRLPGNVMKFLIENFKNVDFEERYENSSARIHACNDRSMSYEDRSSFWLLHQIKGKDIKGSKSFDWRSNNRIREGEKIVLDGILELLKNAIQIATKNEAGTTKMIPGFVRTGLAVHQEFHLDNKNINLDDKNEAFIVHIPLCVEGMWLRLAKLQNNAILVDEMLHIPFGSGVILPSYQLHTGHYGKVGNFRFHAVISNTDWPGDGLLNLENYLKKNKKVKKGDKKLILLESKKALEQEVDDSTCIASQQDKRSTTAYKNQLTKRIQLNHL